MENHKTVLVELPTGRIELTTDSQDEPVIQFNCSCEDALPYCRAMCCKGRPLYNILVPPDRKDLETTPHPYNNTLTVLKTNGNRCGYLTDENGCSIHENKPPICKTWHCSPGGVGENLTQKCGGWNLRISQVVQQDETQPDQ